MLKWETFTDAANEAGMSRRDAGIHFKASDVAGRRLGRVVADNAWQKAQSYFDGTAKRDLFVGPSFQEVFAPLARRGGVFVDPPPQIRQAKTDTAL